MSKFQDLTGIKIGKLTPIKRVYKDNVKIVLWECKCDCGNITVVAADDLRKTLKNVYGATKSCGCLRKQRFYKHGKINTRLYTIWSGMKERCYNSNSERYKDYGGRGITICDEWLENFMNFYNWAMSNGYKDNLTIDRINVDGNYEPSNCRWITIQEQQRNKRKKTEYLKNIDIK